ncbi:MAG: HD domain-containing protein [Balneolaceae bacterium]|nr:HD domain-containing protein [Balneolaceae bacterium]
MDKSTRYKIFNDPVQGFITVPKGIILRLIDHPYVQRLRRIRQLGLGYLVFPGAEHSRFSHALGALELGQRVLQNLREKDTTISDKEYEGTLIALLLHDVGHGPLSHTLEHTLIKNFTHEMMSLAIMKELNKQFDGALDTAIQIFTNQYPKKFLYQLVSSQLDLDRLDYLRRDSFFTGVSEGTVGINRILKTMRVFNGNIVIEKKGIYALENYIIARRLMYMQVYLHKTVLSADALLRMIFKRVSDVLDSGVDLHFASPKLEYFVKEKPSAKKKISRKAIDLYAALDDYDVYQNIKDWQYSKDIILADLCSRFLNRDLFRTTFLENKPSKELLHAVHDKTYNALVESGFPIPKEQASYYYQFDVNKTEAYKYRNESIWILDDNEAIEFSKAADTKNIIALTEPIVRHFVVHLKSITI